MSKVSNLEPLRWTKGEQHFYNTLLKALKRRSDDYESHLNKCYGALRAPNYIKTDEVSKVGLGKNPTKWHFYDPDEEGRLWRRCFRRWLRKMSGN